MKPYVILLMIPVLFLSSCREKLDLVKNRNEHANELMDSGPYIPDEVLAEPLKLNEILAIGLKYNPDLNVSDLELKIFEKQYIIERLRGIPKLNANYRKSRRNNYRKQKFLNPDTGVEVLSNTVSELRTSESAGLDMSWSMLDLGISHYRSKQARMNHVIMQMHHRRKAQQLVLDLTRSYWEAAVSEDARDYLRRTEGGLKKQRAILQDLEKQQKIDPLSAKESEKRLVDLSLSLHQISIDVSNSRLILAQLMGIHPNQDFRLHREPIKPFLSKIPRPEQIDIRKLEATALKNRSELFESDMQIRISQDEVKTTMLQLFPNLSFNAGTHWDGNRLVQNNTWSNAGYSLTWSLLDIPRLVQQLKFRKKQVTYKEAERLAVSMSILAQVHIALLDYNNKVKRFKIIEESSTLATEILKLTRERYKARKVNEYTLARRTMEEVSERLKKDRSIVELLVSYEKLMVSIGHMPGNQDPDFKKIDILTGPKIEDKTEKTKPKTSIKKVEKRNLPKSSKKNREEIRERKINRQL